MVGHMLNDSFLISYSVQYRLGGKNYNNIIDFRKIQKKDTMHLSWLQMKSLKKLSKQQNIDLIYVHHGKDKGLKEEWLKQKKTVEKKKTRYPPLTRSSWSRTYLWMQLSAIYSLGVFSKIALNVTSNTTFNNGTIYTDIARY